jgi:hypothetical protein
VKAVEPRGAGAMQMNKNHTLSDQRFWAIIADASGDRNRFMAILQGMNREEMIELYNKFKQFSADVFDVVMADATEESEDGLNDLAEAIVSQGEEYFVGVMEGLRPIPQAVALAGKTLSGVIDNLFWDRFGESVPMTR